MSVNMEELESKFSVFDGYNIHHKQDYYVITLKLNENNINIHISKELEYLYVESDDYDFNELNTRLIFDKNLSTIKDYIEN